jgi:hypothetical protein
MNNTARLTGNQKRFLANPPTKQYGDKRLVFAYTDAQLKTVRQLVNLGFLVRYQSTSGFWEMTDKVKELNEL